MKQLFIIALLSLLSCKSLPGQELSLKIPEGCKVDYFFTSDSVGLSYLIAGKGEALVFIPGWCMPAEIWENQIAYFSKTNLVIALDPRAQGRSMQTTNGLSFDTEARDIKELVDHLKLSSYLLVGWSWAGLTLYHYLNLYNSPAVKGVVIVDSPLRIDEALLGRMKTRIKGLLDDRDKTTNAFVRGLYKQPHSESYFQKVIRAAKITPATSAITMLSNFFVYNDSVWLQTFKTAGERMLFITVEGKENLYIEISRQVKLNYVVISGAGHAVFADKPAEFNEIVRKFISQPGTRNPQN